MYNQVYKAQITEQPDQSYMISVRLAEDNYWNISANRIGNKERFYYIDKGIAPLPASGILLRSVHLQEQDLENLRETEDMIKNELLRSRESVLERLKVKDNDLESIADEQQIILGQEKLSVNTNLFLRFNYLCDKVFEVYSTM